MNIPTSIEFMSNAMFGKIDAMIGDGVRTAASGPIYTHVDAAVVMHSGSILNEIQQQMGDR